MGATSEAILAGEETEGPHIVGLISDTHGVLDEATILALCQATSTVIHAGDVGDKRYKKRLSAAQLITKLAEGTGKTVVAVSGNVDEGCTELPEWEIITVAGKVILVIHIAGFPPKNTRESQELVKSKDPDIVIFGHSHVPGVQKHDRAVYINPGSAGPKRFNLPRCISLLSIDISGNIMVRFIPIGNLAEDFRPLPPTFTDFVSCVQVQDSISTCASEPCIEEETTDGSVGVEHKRHKKLKLK